MKTVFNKFQRTLGNQHVALRLILGLALLSPLTLSAPPSPAQPDGINIEDLMDVGTQWAQDNLDENVLRAFQDADSEKVQALFRDLQKQFQGEYVLNLAALKNTADTVLPLLEAHEEMAPYAAWLRARMDYLSVAEELAILVPPPKPIPGQPPPPPPKPSPALERQVWQKFLSIRPMPTAAEQYATRLKPVFAARQVPPQLVWLAEVESSFNPAARSPVGATGLYQLMPATAQRFGLALRPKDERLHPEKSADAAAQYLKILHTQFKDWRLALAAYNAGEGTVQKLLTRYKASTFDGIATHLPAETQMYVPKAEATLLRREGVSLAKLAYTPATGGTRSSQN